MTAGERRVRELQRRMADDGIGLFVFNDADSIFYFAEAHDYLGMEFARATILTVPAEGAPVLITPAMEAPMLRAMTWLDDVREWSDGIDGEWGKPLRDILQTAPKDKAIAVETMKTHPSVLDVVRHEVPDGPDDASAITSQMRMVKNAQEIETMRQAGEVAVAMVKAARVVMAEGVPEYEVALAVIAGGTRKAAQFLGVNGPDRFFSPTIYNLQILQSGHHTCMVHRRSTVKRLAKGDPVYLCFCGIANFKNFKLGFDRQFFIGDVSDDMARVQETAIAAQQAALAEIRPGAVAQDINAAAEEIYMSGGFGPSYRTGRGIGWSFLEEPQLKRGDMTVLKPGMTFAVDGGITVPDRFGGRIGDSIVVTDDGFEYLTNFPREVSVI